VCISLHFISVESWLHFSQCNLCCCFVFSIGFTVIMFEVFSFVGHFSSCTEINSSLFYGGCQ
jgi:hypothetical protein